MSSGFISESELAERRRIRQEEWEKVRQPNQPLEAPEEEYDHRSLFERLEEQKKKKEFEYEESHRLKNMIKGLDNDEIDFLDLVDRSKMEEERKKCTEEEMEMADFRNRVATLQEQSLEQRIQQEVKRPLLKVSNNIKSGRTSQTKLLAGVVIKKRQLPGKNNETVAKRSRNESEEGQENQVSEHSLGNENGTTNLPPSSPTDERQEKKDTQRDESGALSPGLPPGTPNEQGSPVTKSASPRAKTSGFTCIGILPGLGPYSVSSDESDCSTDLEEDADLESRYDLLGRRIKRQTKLSSAK